MNSKLLLQKKEKTCFLGKNNTEQMIKKGKKCGLKNYLLITDMKKKRLFVMVLQSFGFVAFISDEKKMKMFDKKK